MANKQICFFQFVVQWSITQNCSVSLFCVGTVTIIPPLNLFILKKDLKLLNEIPTKSARDLWSASVDDESLVLHYREINCI
jgi:hypothetical protein